MTSSTTMNSCFFYTHTYANEDFQVSFIRRDDFLRVEIETKRLYMRSITSTEQDLNSYSRLLTDRDVISTFGSGTQKTEEEIKKKIDEVWVKRLHQDNPYSALAVFKKESNHFVGHLILGPTKIAGQAKLAGICLQEEWDKGFAKEAASAIIQMFAPATVEEGYLIEGQSVDPLEEKEEKALDTVIATPQRDNAPALSILKDLGFKKISEQEKNGVTRSLYSTCLSKLPDSVIVK